jgi:hypothetical protein
VRTGPYSGEPQAARVDGWAESHLSGRRGLNFDASVDIHTLQCKAGARDAVRRPAPRLSISMAASGPGEHKNASQRDSRRLVFASPINEFSPAVRSTYDPSRQPAKSLLARHAQSWAEEGRGAPAEHEGEKKAWQRDDASWLRTDPALCESLSPAASPSIRRDAGALEDIARDQVDPELPDSPAAIIARSGQTTSATKHLFGGLQGAVVPTDEDTGMGAIARQAGEAGDWAALLGEFATAGGMITFQGFERALAAGSAHRIVGLREVQEDADDMWIALIGEHDSVGNVAEIAELLTVACAERSAAATQPATSSHAEKHAANAAATQHLDVASDEDMCNMSSDSMVVDVLSRASMDKDLRESMRRLEDFIGTQPRASRQEIASLEGFLADGSRAKNIKFPSSFSSFEHGHAQAIDGDVPSAHEEAQARVQQDGAVVQAGMSPVARMRGSKSPEKSPRKGARRLAHGGGGVVEELPVRFAECRDKARHSAGASMTGKHDLTAQVVTVCGSAAGDQDNQGKPLAGGQVGESRADGCMQYRSESWRAVSSSAEGWRTVSSTCGSPRAVSAASRVAHNSSPHGGSGAPVSAGRTTGQTLCPRAVSPEPRPPPRPSTKPAMLTSQDNKREEEAEEEAEEEEEERGGRRSSEVYGEGGEDEDLILSTQLLLLRQEEEQQRRRSMQQEMEEHLERLEQSFTLEAGPACNNKDGLGQQRDSSAPKGGGGSEGCAGVWDSPGSRALAAYTHGAGQVGGGDSALASNAENDADALASDAEIDAELDAVLIEGTSVGEDSLSPDKEGWLRDADKKGLLRKESCVMKGLVLRLEPTQAGRSKSFSLEAPLAAWGAPDLDRNAVLSRLRDGNSTRGQVEGGKGGGYAGAAGADGRGRYEGGDSMSPGLRLEQRILSRLDRERNRERDKGTDQRKHWHGQEHGKGVEHGKGETGGEGQRKQARPEVEQEHVSPRDDAKGARDERPRDVCAESVARAAAPTPSPSSVIPPPVLAAVAEDTAAEETKTTPNKEAEGFSAQIAAIVAELHDVVSSVHSSHETMAMQAMSDEQLLAASCLPHQSCASRTETATPSAKHTSPHASCAPSKAGGDGRDDVCEPTGMRSPGREARDMTATRNNDAAAAACSPCPLPASPNRERVSTPSRPRAAHREGPGSSDGEAGGDGVDVQGRLVSSLRQGGGVVRPGWQEATLLRRATKEPHTLSAPRTASMGGRTREGDTEAEAEVQSAEAAVRGDGPLECSIESPAPRNAPPQPLPMRFSPHVRRCMRSSVPGVDGSAASGGQQRERLTWEPPSPLVRAKDGLMTSFFASDACASGLGVGLVAAWYETAAGFETASPQPRAAAPAPLCAVSALAPMAGGVPESLRENGGGERRGDGEGDIDAIDAPRTRPPAPCPRGDGIGAPASSCRLDACRRVVGFEGKNLGVEDASCGGHGAGKEGVRVRLPLGDVMVICEETFNFGKLRYAFLLVHSTHVGQS